MRGTQHLSKAKFLRGPAVVGRVSSEEVNEHHSLPVIFCQRTVFSEVLTSTYLQVNRVYLSIDYLLGFASQKKQCEIVVRRNLPLGKLVT